MEQPALPPSDEELVRLTLRERSYYGYLVERYEARLSRYVRRLGVRDLEDQRDVLQEVFIKAYRNLNSFDTRLAFSSWIYRIAHNEAVSWFRKQNVRPEGHLIADSDEVLALVGSGDEAPDERFDRSVNAEAIATALSKLEKKYRDVLILRFFEHKEYEEISDILKLPVGSVGTLIHRGKKQLASALNHDAIRI